MSFISSAINSATNAVNTVKNTLSESGPASSLSALGTSITGALSGALGSVAGSIGNILSAVGTGVVQVDTKLPMPNVLHDYASYDYVITMGCLSAQEFNFPNESYMAGRYPPIMLKSANGDPDNRIKTVAGKFDFYIDNLTLVGQYGFEKSTGNTNSTNIEFTVIEPYSMGMFMTVVQQAAFEQGYKNYTDAAYLLMIEFRGADQAGTMKVVPNTRKFIPFRFNNLQFKVTAAGSVYNIVATIANSVALTDSYRLVKNDVSIKGKTVQEILQTGEQSLQVVANGGFKQAKEDKQVSVPDEILILFPNDISSAPQNSSPGTAKESNSSATTSSSQVSSSALFQKLGVNRSSANQTLTQDTGACNPLGRASLGFDVTRPGDKPMTNSSEYYDEKTQTYIRGKNVANPKEVVMQFAPNTDIINIINQVLIKSDASKVALDPSQISAEGMRPWWRVDVQTYHIPSDANMKNTGQIPKLIVYRVIPYKVHASRLLPPNAAAPGIQQLKAQAAKEYNYIYTGKNVDVLRFDIQINNTFYNPVLADGGKRTEDKKTAGSTATDAPATPEGNTAPAKGAAPPKPGEGLPSAMRADKTGTGTEGKGGTQGETAANRVARMFHDSLLLGTDMQNIDFDIVGDPYFIANSGKGNYVDNPTNLINVTKDGSVNYQSSEVDIVINFRTPIDINQSTGLYDLNNTKLAQNFSGLYKLTTITSTFSKGQFKQNLKCFRRQGQDSKATPDPKSLITSLLVPDTNKGSSSTELRTPAEIKASKDLGDFAG
jgi:hypothetical protein